LVSELKNQRQQLEATVTEMDMTGPLRLDRRLLEDELRTEMEIDRLSVHTGADANRIAMHGIVSSLAISKFLNTGCTAGTLRKPVFAR
jgi:hypothetical protein